MNKTDTPIPPEVVKAAAMQLPGMAGFPHLVEAAIRAALRAWPGMQLSCLTVEVSGRKILLPLTENTNADIVKRLRVKEPTFELAEEAADEIERLRAALEPFAKVARVFDEDVRSNNTPRSGAWYCWAKMVDEKPVDYILTVEHMRAARAALEGK